MGEVRPVSIKANEGYCGPKPDTRKERARSWLTASPGSLATESSGPSNKPGRKLLGRKRAGGTEGSPHPRPTAPVPTAPPSRRDPHTSRHPRWGLWPAPPRPAAVNHTACSRDSEKGGFAGSPDLAAPLIYDRRKLRPLSQ